MKLFIAYAIYNYKQECDCSTCGYKHVYDSEGYSYKLFDTYKAAKEAAKALMKREGCVQWKVLVSTNKRT